MHPEVSAIACHHTGDLVKLYDTTVFESTNVLFESLVISSDPRYRKLNLKSLIISTDNAMPAAKRNEGASYATGKYFAFFDDDVELTPTCLYYMKKYLDDNPSVGMVYAKTLNMEHRHRFDEAGSYLTWTGFLYSRAGQHIVDEGQFDYPTPILAGKSAACMVRSEVFYEVGQFDEDFGILGEETDLSWRIWLRGYQVHFVPDAVAYHAFNTSFKPRDKYYTDDRVYYNGCRNYITLLLKNLETHNLWRVLPIHVLIWTGASFAMILTLRIGAGMKILSGIWYVLKSWKVIMEKRRKVQKGRLKDDRDIFPFIVGKPPRGYYAFRLWKYVTSRLHG